MPIRTCVGCRVATEQSSLLRIVRAGDGFALDSAGGAPGRGAYVHADRACVERALRTRGVQRTLRVPAVPSPQLADLLAGVDAVADV